MSKVYCKDCKYLQMENFYRGELDCYKVDEKVEFLKKYAYCNHHNNIITKDFPEKWYEDYKYAEKTDKNPSELNKNNDCQWYEKKD